MEKASFKLNEQKAPDSFNSTEFCVCAELLLVVVVVVVYVANQSSKN